MVGEGCPLLIDEVLLDTASVNELLQVFSPLASGRVDRFGTLVFGPRSLGCYRVLSPFVGESQREGAPRGRTAVLIDILTLASRERERPDYR